MIGAGLADLSAAYELDRAGYDVDILEARTRPGGRVFTLREPFSDGHYAEAGAARIQDSHQFTLKYAKQFGLTLDPFWPTDGASVTCVGGKRMLLPAGKQLDLDQLPLAFSAEERRLGLRGSFGKYLFSHLAEVGDPASPDWPAAKLKRFEVSLPDFLSQQGAGTRSRRHVHSTAITRRCDGRTHQAVVQDSGRKRPVAESLCRQARR